MSKHRILSVGGSIVIPTTGFDIKFLKKFHKLILSRVKKGDKFVLVVGGGNTARTYIQAAKKITKLTDTDLDWLGIQATWQNAKFIQLLFGKYAHGDIVSNPTKKVKTNKPIIVAGGWKPGWSTDYVAVLLAKTYGAKELINLSNIDYVYTADPKKVKSAKPIKELSWPEMKKLIGNKWTPGANLPLDPKATKEAARLKLRVGFVKGTSISDLKAVLGGKRAKGSVIS